MGSNYDPVHFAATPPPDPDGWAPFWKGPGWYFWDETQADRIGPYPTEGVCREKLKEYADGL